MDTPAGAGQGLSLAAGYLAQGDEGWKMGPRGCENPGRRQRWGLQTEWFVLKGVLRCKSPRCKSRN